MTYARNSHLRRYLTKNRYSPNSFAILLVPSLQDSAINCLKSLARRCRTSNSHNPSQMSLAVTFRFSERRWRHRMLRKAFLYVALCLLPAAAYGQAAHGPFELEIGGSGAN